MSVGYVVLMWNLKGIIIGFFVFGAGAVHAAVGCSLANPDSDIRRFFPSMSHYVVNYISFENQNPRGLLQLEAALGDELDPVYETADVPFTLYTVDGDQGRLGYVFGANQRGEFSNIQVIVVANPDLSLREIYIQRLRSPSWELLQGDTFLDSLSAIPLEDFPKFHSCYSRGECGDVPVDDPTNGVASTDYRAILRAVAKLHLISIHLLRPGLPPYPPNEHARAEWIGNYRGPLLNINVLSDADTLGRAEVDRLLSPVEPIYIWRVGEVVRGYPISTLHRYPVIEDSFLGGEISVVLAGLHGDPVVLDRPAGVHFRPTMDTLYGGRVVVELGSGAVWSPVLASPVYEGEASGVSENLRVGRGGVTLPWASVRNVFPEIEIVMVPNLPTSTPNYGEMIVVRDGEYSPAWRVSELSQGVNEAEVGTTPVILVREAEQVLAWQATLDGRSLRFESLNSLEMRDIETGSTWSSIRGEAVSGELLGAKLLPMVQMRMSEFEWRSHFGD